MSPAIKMYETKIRHDGLNKFRVICGRDPLVVEEKARMQHATWGEQWERKLERLAKAEARREAGTLKEENDRLAKDRTEAAQEAIETIRNTLAHTLSVDDTIRWDELKHTDRFDESEPKPPFPPDPDHISFEPQIGFLDRHVSGSAVERRRTNRTPGGLRSEFRRHRERSDAIQLYSVG